MNIEHKRFQKPLHAGAHEQRWI